MALILLCLKDNLLIRNWFWDRMNSPYYKNATQVDAVEPNSLMVKKFLNRQKQTKVPI